MITFRDTQVIEQLKAETAHAKAALADTEELQEELYRELRGRIQEVCPCRAPEQWQVVHVERNKCQTL
jgi:protease II